MPTFPSFDFTRLDLTRLDAERLGALARDAAYVAIGLGVLTFQEAQVRRRDLAKTIDRVAASARAQVDDVLRPFS
jgi:hypothetical protein